ncbi:hypothetical protein BOX15_Mlig007517g4, partial [Macrostomum lignano]
SSYADCSSLKLRLQRVAMASEMAAGNRSVMKAVNPKEEARLFNKHYQQMAGDLFNRTATDVCMSALCRPRHRMQTTELGTELRARLVKEARAAHLQRKCGELLNSEELKTIWHLLVAHRTLPDSADGERFINYLDYLKVCKAAGPKCSKLLSPSLFFKLLQADPLGRVSTDHLYEFISRKTWLLQTRVCLSLYDFSGDGSLSESDLENYVTNLIPTLYQLRKLDKLFYSYYVCTAVRKFVFFLDPLRTGRVRIFDILTSSFLDDFAELQVETSSPSKTNWFSAYKTLRLYGSFLALDKDANGLLSKTELAGYGAGSLTDAFLDRLFQTCVTLNGEMDYQAYLDFCLAMECRSAPQSLSYFFRILDIDSCGAITAWSVNYFYRGLQRRLRSHGVEPPRLPDLMDEIFDMARPADPCRIGLEDLINSGQGATIVSILIDASEFWRHESRSATAPDTVGDGPAEPDEEELEL